MPVTVIPDPHDVRAVQAWMDVDIDGSALRMLLDTGSRRSAVPASTVAGLVSDQTVSSGHGVSGVDVKTSRATVRLTLPGAHSCDRLDVEVQSDDWPHPPLLGRDVFDGCACDFRLTEGAVEINPAQPPDGLRGFEPWRGGPGVAMRWGETIVNAFWDTGAGITIVDRNWADEHPEAVEVLDQTGHGTDVTGSEVAGVHGRMKGYAIEDLEFPDQACGVVDLSGLNAQLSEPIHIMLGLPQIVLANWYVDFDAQILAIYPATK